jgi:putative DNA methylase
MSEGTPLIEVNRIGCDAQGFDINPMSTSIVREELEHIDLAAYASAARELTQALAAEYWMRSSRTRPTSGTSSTRS